ncbi:putative polygalacturonase [Lupinus albus]|uniref:Putative polygalacturonase n=1 Tax=Lupinus albus TaxID=3870 RepID=A0A6A4NGA7_LUPAL|nr:putative polygalacturonase [Lupinus albus]
MHVVPCAMNSPKITVVKVTISLYHHYSLLTYQVLFIHQTHKHVYKSCKLTLFHCIQTQHNMASPSSLFFQTLILSIVIYAVTPCPPSDRAALLAFRAALTEPYMGIFNSWSGYNCCQSWYGVTCDPTTYRVTDITLRGDPSDKNLQNLRRSSGLMTGNISPEICNLGNLTTLVVADWKSISGEIPSCVTSLSLLRIIDLSGNQISGEIPVDIGKLQRLVVLNLGDNAIFGDIPASIVDLAGLMHLDLSNNKISGELPSDFRKLNMLSRALLSQNNLTGSIPNSISKMNRLADLDLSMNRFTGSIPVEFGQMKVWVY